MNEIEKGIICMSGQYDVELFTGTTYECAMEIIKGGYISTRPPKRVWEEYSTDYVYFADPDRCDEATLEQAVAHAAEQAAFSVWKFDHTRRVIFSVQVDSALLDDDPDCHFAVRYPFDVPLSQINGVYVEKRNACRKLKELIGITELFRREKKIEVDPDEWAFIKRRYRGLEYVPYNESLMGRHEELLSWHVDLDLFTYIPIQRFIKTIQQKVS